MNPLPQFQQTLMDQPFWTRRGRRRTKLSQVLCLTAGSRGVTRRHQADAQSGGSRWFLLAFTPVTLLPLSLVYLLQYMPSFFKEVLAASPQTHTQDLHKSPVSFFSRQEIRLIVPVISTEAWVQPDLLLSFFLPKIVPNNRVSTIISSVQSFLTFN